MFNKSCQIIAFEPNPIIFAKARSRFEGQCRDNGIHNVGLSAERASKTLYVPKYRTTYFDELASFDSESSTELVFSQIESWVSIVGVFCLRNLSAGLPHLDDYLVSPAIIKIDVQGYETQVRSREHGRP